ncbi:MAG: NAD-dependent epimerase/dehydratase family protein [Streptosporangiaceae bacterium]
MAIVVTGAAGFIGSNLVGFLHEAGRDVVAIDRRGQPALPGLTCVKAELGLPDDAVDAALRDADMVLHLAGCPGVRDRSPDVAWRRHRDNVLAARRVLESTPLDTMVVLASSSSVYGGSDGTACRENQPVRPRGGYATSKVEAERLCGARAAAGGAVVVARLFTVAGEGQRPDMALSRWIADVAAGRPARVYGSLGRTRDISDVRDVCAAMLALAEHQASGIVNIGTGTAHTLAEMLEAVGTALGQAVTVDLEPADHDDPDATLADPTRLLELTGVRPHTDLAGLVRRQAAAALGQYLRGDDPPTSRTPAYPDDVAGCPTPTASTGLFLPAAVILDLSPRPEARCPMDVNTRRLLGYSDGRKNTTRELSVILNLLEASELRRRCVRYPLARSP